MISKEAGLLSWFILSIAGLVFCMAFALLQVLGGYIFT